MIKNGHQGDFAPSEDQASRPHLVDTSENVNKIREMCMKSHLRLEWTGEISDIDMDSVQHFCRMSTYEDRIWFNDQGEVQPAFTSEYIQQVTQAYL